MNPIEKVLKQTELSQENLAKSLKLTRQTLINYNNKPDTIPFKIIKSLINLSGLSYHELFEAESYENDFSSKYKSGFFESINQHASKIKESIEDTRDNISSSNIPNPLCEKAISEIEAQLSSVQQLQKKLNVAITGFAGVDKTSLAHKMIGQDKFITKETITTDFPVIFKHIDDFPQNDLFDNSISINSIMYFSYDMTTSDDVVYGDYEYLIKKYNSPENNKNTSTNIKKMEVFIDSELLKDINLIDTPPINNHTLDEIFLPKYDAIIYVTSPFLFSIADKQDALFKLMLKSGIDFKNIIFLISNSRFIEEDNTDEFMEQYKDSLLQPFKNNVLSFEHDQFRELKDTLDSRCYLADFVESSSKNLTGSKVYSYQKDFVDGFSIFISDIYKTRKENYISSELVICDNQIELYQSHIDNLGDSGTSIDSSIIESAKEEIIEAKIDFENKIYDCQRHAEQLFNNEILKISKKDTIIEYLHNNNLGKNKIHDLKLSIIYDQILDAIKKQFIDDSATLSKLHIQFISNMINEYSFLQNDPEAYAIIKNGTIKLSDLERRPISNNKRARKKASLPAIKTDSENLIKALGDGFFLGSSSFIYSDLLDTYTAAGLGALGIGVLLGIGSASVIAKAVLKKNQLNSNNLEKRVAKEILDYINKPEYTNKMLKSIDQLYHNLSKYNDYLVNLSDYCTEKITADQNDHNTILTMSKRGLYQSLQDMYNTIKRKLNNLNT